ncbi:MAG: hypothetical protein ACK417_12275 [Bacteroidia bacterium]
MKAFFIALQFLLFALNLPSVAQNHQPAVNLTFLYPYGVDGQASAHKQYDFSLNLLGGHTGLITGFEVGGLFNRNSTGVEGAQVAGLFNQNKGHVHGSQVAGLFNRTGQLAGIQVAGLANRSDQTHGIQVAGLFNRTGRLNGMQVGLVNLVDTLEEGVSIGLVNWYRNGMYRELELSNADYAQFRVAYKFGLKQFYTLITAGGNTYQRSQGFFGFGAGHLRQLNEQWDFQPEIVGFTYFEQSQSAKNWKHVTHLKAGFAYKINEQFALTLAPSVYWSNQVATTDPFTEVSRFRPVGSGTFRKLRYEAGYGLSVALQWRH